MSKRYTMEWIIPTKFSNGRDLGAACFPIIYISDTLRPNKKLYKQVVNHERIHLRQQLELLIIPFWIWYFLEYLVYLVVHQDSYQAYRSIRFEKECWKHDKDLNYLSHRKPYNYIFNQKAK